MLTKFRSLNNALLAHPYVFAAMFGSSVLVALGSYRFVLMGFEGAFGDEPPFSLYLEYERVAFLAHVIASPIALLVGAFQFLGAVRAKWPQVHRWFGRIYVGAILLGAASGFYLATTMVMTRPIDGIGLGLLSVLWIATVIVGVIAARNKQFDLHETWMVYAFALTFSAVTLRIHLMIAFGFGLTYEDVSHILAWSCWVPNLIFAWWLLRRRQTTKPIEQPRHLSPSSLSVTGH